MNTAIVRTLAAGVLLAATGASQDPVAEPAPEAAAEETADVPAATPPLQDEPLSVGELIGGLFGEGAATLLDDLRELPRDATLLPALLDRVDPNSGLGRLLEDVNFRAKTFEDEAGTARIGFEYDFSKSLVSSPKDGDDDRWRYGASFFGRGNVALDSAFNPNDFLETGVRLSLFRHSFRAPLQAPASPEVQTATQDLFKRIAEDDLEPDDYMATAEWQRVRQNVAQVLGREVLFDASLHATFESDQEFANYQYAYGINAGLVIKEWDDDAPLSRLNVFDYPFAVIRMLTGEDENFAPSGRALPSFLAGIDLVDPHADQGRIALAEDNDYARFRAEVSMKTVLGRIGDTRIWASLNWRYYREIDAPSAVEAANLDEFSYFAARVDLPGGLFVGYAAGQLPFDANNASLAQLGFQWSF